MKWAILAASAIALPLMLTGCYTPSSSGAVYTSGQTGREQTVRMGVVESVRQVTIEGTRGEIGTLAGGAVGGIAGSDVGGGKGSGVGTILGAVVGGVAGSAIERGVTQKKGVEVTVRLDKDRKSTRLNSSHLVISYAVFCLKKKKKRKKHRYMES